MVLSPANSAAQPVSASSPASRLLPEFNPNLCHGPLQQPLSHLPAFCLTPFPPSLCKLQSKIIATSLALSFSSILFFFTWKMSLSALRWEPPRLGLSTVSSVSNTYPTSLCPILHFSAQVTLPIITPSFPFVPKLGTCPFSFLN